MKTSLTALFLTVAALPLGAADLSRATALYQHTDYAGAMHVLLPDKNDKQLDAPAYALAGKSSFMLGDFGKAGDYFQKAVNLAPGNSEYVLWLGRTWGRKAEKANPFSAPGDARRARDCFEKAVALDGHSIEALGDLFDYYLQAPGFLGGGLDKAEATAHRIEGIDQAEGRFDLARLAIKRKQTAEAEGHFRAAVNLAPKAVGHAVAFARFLTQQGRLKDADAVLAQAQAAAPESPRLMYGVAAIQIETHRDTAEARRLLQRYLTCSLTPDDPPREAAEKLLRQTSGT